MSDRAPSSVLQQLFHSNLDSEEIDEIITGFESIDAKAQIPALNVGLILSDFSKKGAASYFRTAPEVLQLITTDELERWVGMGIKICQKSAASGIRFFNEAPQVFSQIQSSTLRPFFLGLGSELADENVNLAMEYYRQTPLLLSHFPLTKEAFFEWAREGRALGKEDYGLAVEYFRITPALLPYLPLHLLPLWINVGKKLSAEKMLPTLIFMRNSPEVFSKITNGLEKEKLLDLTREIAEQSPLLAGQVFSDSVTILPPFHLLSLQKVLFEKGIEIAKFNAEIAADLFLNGPKVLKEMGSLATHFERWVDEGILLLQKGSSAAGGFFSLKGRSGHEAITRLRGGVSLSSVSKTLKIFAEALSGKPVSIQPCSRLETSDKDETPSAQSAEAPTTDGETIYLPPHVCYFQDNQLNFEWYKVATAYQAGYLEFNTFSPQINETADLIESLQEKYKKRGGFSSLSSFFSLFPEPGLIEALFEIAEGGRIEAALRREYPGLRPAMNRMREEDLSRRPPLVGLTPRGAVVELLRQISLAGKTKTPIPETIQKLIFEVCRVFGAVQEPSATVAIAMKASASAFELVYEGEDNPEAITGPMEAFEEEGSRTEGKGEESGEIRPSTRGMIDPKRVEKTKKLKEQYTNALLEKLKAAGVDLSSEALTSALSKSVEEGELKLETLKEGKASEQIEEVAERLKAEQSAQGNRDRKRSFFYDEWNCEEDEYRLKWCRVSESTVDTGEAGPVQAILNEYHGMIHSITSAFQLLRPEGYKRIKGEKEGDALDLDALLVSRVEAKFGNPSDHIYISQRKKERSVAVAFLIDLSGSTQQHLSNRDKSILQIEKEALILMAKAVDTIGDAFGLYGFSGKGKDQVDFHILKDFNEAYSPEIDRRIAQIAPEIQNRDGAAIRHAASKLIVQPAKTRVLVLISDGKPLDDDYRGSYATADTRMALREAKRGGVHPYCITVDREGAEYLKGMYGEVAYMVIDHLETLPIRLPQIYKRLTA